MGFLLGNPNSASAQFIDDQQPNSIFPKLIADDDIIPSAFDRENSPAPISIYQDYQDVSTCPDCFVVEGESWTDWHGVPEVFEHPDENPGFSLSYFQECEIPEEEPEFHWKIWEKFMHVLEMPHEPFVKLSEMLTRAKHDGTVFTDPDYSWTSDIAIGVQPILDRPPLILEYPAKFLGQGTIRQGFELPTGAVWRPTFWVFGSNRFGVSYRDDQGGRNFGSVVNRLSLFGQLDLTGTEHVVVQLRPFDEEQSGPLLAGREFTSSFWKTHTVPTPGGAAREIGSLDAFNGDLNTIYFEGQLDEIFPNLDPFDTKFLDLGFSVGRQPMSFQRGLMLNEDMIDAVTVTRNTLFGHGNLNLRMTGVFAWNRLSRVAPLQNTDAKLYGLFTESDFKFATVNVDIGFIDDPNRSNRDVLVAAVSSTQRFVGYENTYNTRFHVLVSFPTEGEGARTNYTGSPGNVTGQGELFFSQISMTPHRGEDLIYWNTFVVVDQFTSLARDPGAGPLGDTGLLFAAAGLGLYGPPLSTVTNSSVGTALGYQVFLDTKNQQIVYEIGAREGKGNDDLEIAGAIQYQRAFRQNWIWLITGFLSSRHGTDGLSQGLRTEIQLFF
ncbi:MAG: hypothetical protein IID46_09685 [Planctomycetes bacterium]|nr:hypothetical protein [Planctomycetota bacterium]